MEYFVCKLEHDGGTAFLKTSASCKEEALVSVMDMEACPQSAVKIKKIPYSMMSFPSDVLWKMYDKPFKLKMVNRKSVIIIEYLGHSARVKYVKTGKECTVSRTMIREHTPKTK